MKKYFLKIKCKGRFPTHMFRTVEAESVADAIYIQTMKFVKDGTFDIREIVMVSEIVWTNSEDVAVSIK